MVTFKYNKIKISVPENWDDITLGMWVDVDEVQKKGEKILSNILAIVCRPAGEEYNHENNESRTTMFAAQPVSNVLGVLAFFFAQQNSIRTTYSGLYESSSNARPLTHEYKTFSKVWEWYKIIDYLANGKILQYNTVTSLSVKEVFTHLQYKKTRSMPTWILHRVI